MRGNQGESVLAWLCVSATCIHLERLGLLAGFIGAHGLPAALDHAQDLHLAGEVARQGRANRFLRRLVERLRVHLAGGIATSLEVAQGAGEFGICAGHRAAVGESIHQAAGNVLNAGLLQICPLGECLAAHLGHGVVQCCALPFVIGSQAGAWHALTAEAGNGLAIAEKLGGDGRLLAGLVGIGDNIRRVVLAGTAPSDGGRQPAGLRGCLEVVPRFQRAVALICGLM